MIFFGLQTEVNTFSELLRIISSFPSLVDKVLLDQFSGGFTTDSEVAEYVCCIPGGYFCSLLHSSCWYLRFEAGDVSLEGQLWVPLLWKKTTCMKPSKPRPNSRTHLLAATLGCSQSTFRQLEILRYRKDLPSWGSLSRPRSTHVKSLFSSR